MLGSDATNRDKAEAAIQQSSPDACTFQDCNATRVFAVLLMIFIVALACCASMCEDAYFPQKRSAARWQQHDFTFTANAAKHD